MRRVVVESSEKLLFYLLISFIRGVAFELVPPSILFFFVYRLHRVPSALGFRTRMQGDQKTLQNLKK